MYSFFCSVTFKEWQEKDDSLKLTEREIRNIWLCLWEDVYDTPEWQRGTDPLNSIRQQWNYSLVRSNPWSVYSMRLWYGKEKKTRSPLKVLSQPNDSVFGLLFHFRKCPTKCEDVNPAYQNASSSIRWQTTKTRSSATFKFAIAAFYSTHVHNRTASLVSLVVPLQT